MFSAQELENIPVHTLIPQREPIVMISRVTAYSGKQIRTELDIDEENIFLGKNGFSESGMLENIAQTAAAIVGLEALSAGKEVPLGFIGGITKVKVYELAPALCTVHTQVEILHEIFNITLIKGKQFHLENLLLECEMKIVINP
ncbi:3-hydroxyacyl-ACP dehydratase [Algoriphagus sp. NG3]|uniref:3-hydroxyacyl-ACP dehydratase n=1 Tax=Algoriphagus sp. NG3 TaxID=3097546 RepID=UPI002A7F6F4C|nr:3-hydroxyacyl-ACP dehydratase [Algoriphagus sp. NG3]WPR75895.1 3-hydroxyacyl-ACP dehydratase [Algoriphagus sp. NG3]